MSILHVVPGTYLRQWRRQSPAGVAPVSVQSLAARILKEGLIPPYKEDKILEEVAVWQGGSGTWRRAAVLPPRSLVTPPVFG